MCIQTLHAILHFHLLFGILVGRVLYVEEKHILSKPRYSVQRNYKVRCCTSQKNLYFLTDRPYASKAHTQRQND